MYCIVCIVHYISNSMYRDSLGYCCILEPAFPALLPFCMRFIQGSGWEQLLFITIDQLVSCFLPTLQSDTLYTQPSLTLACTTRVPIG